MRSTNNNSQFRDTLKQIRSKAGVSRYKLAKWTGINEAYLLRLENGDRRNPSRDVVISLGMALAACSEGTGKVDINDIEQLLLSAEYAPLRRSMLGPASPSEFSS